ncbi:copper fist DNA binding domain-containing protein, partial [Emericellopsis atlantica]
IIFNGQNYAYDACVRGHRVRTCEHYGRPLKLISKKGRPISQCQHCRSLRKSRSAHVK